MQEYFDFLFFSCWYLFHSIIFFFEHVRKSVYLFAAPKLQFIHEICYFFNLKNITTFLTLEGHFRLKCHRCIHFSWKFNLYIKYFGVRYRWKCWHSKYVSKEMFFFQHLSKLLQNKTRMHLWRIYHFAKYLPLIKLQDLKSQNLENK